MSQSPEFYISADMEGIAGVVSVSQTVEGGFEYQRARQWMTEEVAIVSEAAFEQGIKRVVVSDSHGNGQNLLLDDLPENVHVVRNWPRPIGMMQGIEAGSFVGAALIGHHTSAQSADGILAHTFSGLLLTGVSINGQSASETTVNALIANHFRTPIILASGDAAYIDYLAQSHPDILGVTTKQACGRQSALVYSRASVLKELQQATTQAVGQALQSPPSHQPIAGPFELQVSFQRHAQPELLAYLPGVKRVSGLTISYSAKDALELSKFLMFITSYKSRND